MVKSSTRLILNLDHAQAEELEKMTIKGGFLSRQELIRAALRQFLAKEDKHGFS